jgi:cytochrome c2
MLITFQFAIYLCSSMKEIKYILHAVLLLLAFIIILTCLKVIYSIKEPKSEVVFIDNIRTNTVSNSKGKLLFQLKCAACHTIGKNATGPDLQGFEEKGPWAERKNVYKWIRNPMEFMKKNEYTQNLKKAFSGTMMTAFPDLSNEDIDEIISYINGTGYLSFPNTIVRN